MTEFIIDEEFQKLLPPVREITDEELERMIVSEGRVRNPIHVWQGVIADGHRRYRIARKHELPFEVFELDLPDRQSVKDWIVRDFRSRRSATESELRTHLVSLDNKHRRPHRKSRRNQGESAEMAAREAGVSSRTVYRATRAARQLAGLPEYTVELINRHNVRFSEHSIERLKRLSPEDQEDAIHYYVDQHYSGIGQVLDVLHPLKMGTPRDESQELPAGMVLTDSLSHDTSLRLYDELTAVSGLLQDVRMKLMAARRLDGSDSSAVRLGECLESLDLVVDSVERWRQCNGQ